jgi:modulator of FtsH protease
MERFPTLSPMPIGDWAGFFGAQAAAFAALTGLVFVALSINLKTILDTPGTSGRAGEALILLVAPVLLGLAGLMGHQPLRALGAEWLVVGVVAWAAVSVILVSGRQAIRSRPWREAVTRVAGAEGAVLSVIVAGSLLAGGSTSGLYWQAAGIGLCLVTGILDGWVLLVEILR